MLSFVCLLSFGCFDKEFKNSEVLHTRASEYVCHCPEASTEVYNPISLQFHDLFQGGLIKLEAGWHLQRRSGTSPN